MPKISIITPVKNAEAWLEECLQSGLQQQCSDWEWIWVDDHSTDGSAEILKKWSEKDERISFFENEGEGIIDALKLALSKASGEFITRMDADDVMPPERLKTLSEELEASDPKTVVSGQVMYFSKGPVSEGYRKYEDWLNKCQVYNDHWKKIYRECVVASPNWMMRTEELRGIGGFEGLEYPEDYDLVFRWYQNGFSIRSTFEVTLMWREHEYRTSRISDHYSQQAFFEMKIKRFLELDHVKGQALCLWGKGTKAKLTADILKRHKVKFYHMDLKPDKKENILHFEETAKMKKPQVLVAIYPPEKQLKSIKEYLHLIGLAEGESYWLL